MLKTMGEPQAIVPLPAPRSAITPATHVRGTVLCASLKSLRARGLADRYMAALPGERHDAILALTAQTWVPVEIAVAHYQACDRLQLEREVIEDIGGESGRLLNASVLGVILRMSREAGVTPWTVIAQVERLRERLWQGSAFGVFRVGPKEARVEWLGQPCAVSPYYQIAFGAFMLASVRLFCTAVYARILPRLCSATTLGYRLSWV
jgi:hypothetical protein